MIRWVRVDYMYRRRPGALRILADSKGRVIYERPAVTTSRPDGQNGGIAKSRRKEQTKRNRQRRFT